MGILNGLLRGTDTGLSPSLGAGQQDVLLDEDGNPILDEDGNEILQG